MPSRYIDTSTSQLGEEDFIGSVRWEGRSKRTPWIAHTPGGREKRFRTPSSAWRWLRSLKRPKRRGQLNTHKRLAWVKRNFPYRVYMQTVLWVLYLSDWRQDGAQREIMRRAKNAAHKKWLPLEKIGPEGYALLEAALKIIDPESPSGARLDVLFTQFKADRPAHRSLPKKPLKLPLSAKEYWAPGYSESLSHGERAAPVFAVRGTASGTDLPRLLLATEHVASALPPYSPVDRAIPWFASRTNEYLKRAWKHRAADQDEPGPWQRDMREWNNDYRTFLHGATQRIFPQWLADRRPNLEDLSFNEATEQAFAWENNQINLRKYRKAKQAMAKKDFGQVLLRLPDGSELREIGTRGLLASKVIRSFGIDEQELNVVGQYLGHCYKAGRLQDSYVEQLVKGRAALVTHFGADGLPLATAYVRRDPSSYPVPHWTFEEIKGPRNEAVVDREELKPFLALSRKLWRVKRAPRSVGRYLAAHTAQAGELLLALIGGEGDGEMEEFLFAPGQTGQDGEPPWRQNLVENRALMRSRPTALTVANRYSLLLEQTRLESQQDIDIGIIPILNSLSWLLGLTGTFLSSGPQSSGWHQPAGVRPLGASHWAEILTLPTKAGRRRLALIPRFHMGDEESLWTGASLENWPWWPTDATLLTEDKMVEDSESFAAGRRREAARRAHYAAENAYGPSLGWEKVESIQRKALAEAKVRALQATWGTPTRLGPAVLLLDWSPPMTQKRAEELTSKIRVFEMENSPSEHRLTKLPHVLRGYINRLDGFYSRIAIKMFNRLTNQSVARLEKMKKASAKKALENIERGRRRRKSRA